MKMTLAQGECSRPALEAGHNHFNFGCSTGEQASQKLHPGMFAARREETPEAAHPARDQVDARRAPGASDGVSVPPSTHLQYSGSVGRSIGNCAFTALSPETGMTSASSSASSDREELARKRVEKHCLAETMCKEAKQHTSCVSRRSVGGGDREQDTPYLASFGGGGEFKRTVSCAVPPPPSSRVHDTTQGSSQFRWRKALLDVFAPHKPRANLSMVEKEVAHVYRIQCTEELQHLCQKCPAYLPPGRVFHPADAGLPDRRTCTSSRTPQTPQPSAEVTQSSERVVTSQSCGSAHDPGSFRGCCASLQGWSRSGNFFSSPYCLSPKVSSRRCLQAGSVSDEHCSQRDAREAAEAYAALIGSPREAVTAGILGEGTGGRRAPGTSKPAQNPGAIGKLMKAKGICTSVANKLASTPCGTGTAAVPGAETLTDTCHLETLSGARRGVVGTGEEPIEPLVNDFITRRYRDGTADETATNGQRAAPVARVASRSHGSQQNSATVNTRRNISKQLEEDTSCIFQNGVVGRSERRVGTDKIDCNTYRSCAEECCTALPVCAAKGEARLLKARASGLHERNNTPGEATVLRTFEEDTQVWSIDSNSTTRGSAHNEGDNTSVSLLSPTGDFRPRTPSSACASPAFVGVRASSPSTEDLQEAFPCPAPFRRGEQAYCFFGGECNLTASASAYICRDRATCTQKAAARNMGAADTSAPVNHPPAARGFKSPFCAGAATLLGCGSRSRTDEGRNSFQAQSVSPLTAALHTRNDANLHLHSYPFPSASERNTSLGRTVAERPTAGKQDTHLRRAKTADGEDTSFGLRAAVKGAEASRSIQEHRRQASTARSTAGRHEAPGTATQEDHNLTRVTTAVPQRDAGAKDGLSAMMLHRTPSSDVRARVNQHVKRGPSILQTSRSCLESALMRAARITAHLTCRSSGRESGKRGGEDSPSPAGRDRRWRSLGKSVCSRSSSGLSTNGLRGRESGDFVGLKLLSLVRSFQRDSHSDGNMRQQEQPQQPDVRGGSVFVCAQDVGEATLSRLRDYANQELAAGLEDRSSSRRKGYRKLFRSSSFWSIRSDLRSRECRKLRLSSSFHALKKNGGEDEVIALNTDTSLRQALWMKEGKLSRYPRAPSFSRHTNAIQRAATAPPLAAAEASGVTSGVASVSVVEAQRRVGAVVPSAVAETSQGASIAAAPSAAGIHPVSMAANNVVKVAAHGEKPTDREAKTASLRTVGAGVSGGVHATGVDTQRREGTGSFVLPSDSTILRTKETAMDSERGQRSHSLQQQPQREQPGDRPHVWNGDAVGVRNSPEATSATSCRSWAALEGCVVCSFSPSTSSSGAHHDLRGNRDSDDELMYRVSSQRRTAPSASAAALHPTVGFTPCEESPTSCLAITPPTSAAFAESCVNARILAVHRYDGSVLRKHRNVSTGSSNRGQSLPTRAFSSEDPVCSIEERDIASPLSWRKEKRVHNSRCRGASSVASLGVRSQAGLFCSGHLQALRPALLGGSPHLECVSEGSPVQPQTGAKSAATCEHQSQQAKCSAFLRDMSLSSSAGVFVSPSWVKLPSTLFFPRHPFNLFQGLSSVSTEEQQQQGQHNDSSRHTIRQQACKPPKPEAAACVDHCLLRCMQQEQNSQMPHQQTQACQHQQGAARNCALREVLSRHDGKRKSASMFFQVRKAAPTGAVRDQRARSLDVNFVGKNKDVTSQRRRGLSNAPPCGSESETTRCATSCGEGDAEDSVELQFSAEASSGKHCAVSDASAPGGKDCRSPCRCSEVRRTWRRHCGHISCSLSGTGGQKSYGSECSSHSRWIPVTRGKSRLRCKSFPVYVVHSAAISRLGTTPLGLTRDDAALLYLFSSAGEIAQETNGVSALHVQAVPLRKGACSLPAFGADRGSVSRCRPLTTFSEEDICFSGVGVSTASASDNRCTGGGEASQQAMQQWMVDGTFRNANTEGLLLKSTAERSSDVPRGAQEDASPTHEDVALDSPASSRSSVVFTVEESTCETLEDEGNLPFLELLPLAHHRGSRQTQQHHQHDTRQHGSAALAAGCGGMATFRNGGVTREWPEEGRDGSTRDPDVSTLLGCYQALASCWEENADEVNAYVPPSLHRFPQSSVSLLFSTAGLAAHQNDRFTTQLTPVRGAALPRTTAPAAAVDTEAVSMPVVQERESTEAADAARDLAADAAAAGREDSTGVATTDEVAGGGGAADPGGAPGSVLRHVTAGASAGRQGFSVSPPRLHVPMHTRLCASGCSSGGNTASSSRCDSSNIENDCCIKSELRSSDVMSRRHVEPYFGGPRSVRGENFTSSSSTDTCSTISGGTTGDIRESEKEEHGRDVCIQREPTHVRELYLTRVAIAGASFDDKLHAGLQCLLHSDAQLEVKAAKKSEENTLGAGEVKCKPILTSPLALPFSEASCATVDAISSNRQPPQDGETVVSLDSSCKVVARKGAVPYQERVSPYAAQAGSAAEVTSQEKEVSEKQRYRRMEQQQDKEQQQTQKQRQPQKQQREWQHEVKQQSSQQGREKEQREKAQAHQQHGDRAFSVLHVAHGGMHGIFSSGRSEVNNNAVKERIGRRLPCSQETACGRTGAAAAEKVDSAEATSLTGGEEKEFAGSRGSWSAGLTKAQGEEEDIDVSEAGEGHRKHREQLPAGETTNLSTCDTISQPKEQKQTDADLSGSGLEVPERERIETSPSGAVILQVKCSSLLLLLCGSNEALLADLPYFEGPLSLSVWKSTSSALRRQNSSHPRVLKSVQRAAPDVERLYYFVLSRGHLFWFTERSEFSSRGFDACVGSMSLLLNACHVRVDGEMLQQQQKRVSGGESSTHRSNSSTRKCDTGATRSTATTAGRHWTNRFLLQFYKDVSSCSGMGKRVSTNGNASRGPGVRRSSTSISGGAGDTDASKDAEYGILGGMELRVVSGAVFCPASGTLPVNYGEATHGNPPSSALTAGERDTHTAHPTESESVFVTGRFRRRGLLATACTSVDSVSSPTRERYTGDLPLRASASACPTSAPAAAAAGGIAAAGIVPHVAVENGSRSTSVTTASAAAAAPTWLGRLGGARPGRRSAEKKAALASYAAGWVQHLQETIARGEELRRRFPQVNWPQQQLRAMMVASRCGVL